MNLDELKEMINKDLAIDRSKLSHESAHNPLLYTKYVHIRSEIGLEIKKAEIEKKQVATQRWLYYSGKGGGKVSPIEYSQAELKRVMESDEAIIKVDKKLILLDIQRELVDEAVKAFNMRNFTIRQIIDWEKFTQGSI
ncbi:MAG: recombination mediator protein UvsY [Mycoplasmataceae bacterium]|nr:recombination mediator protein UvsY [Mycoplasmataceae bacterium]